MFNKKVITESLTKKIAKIYSSESPMAPLSDEQVRGIALSLNINVGSVFTVRRVRVALGIDNFHTRNRKAKLIRNAIVTKT